MTNELQKQFFDTFGIEPCIRDWWQFNYAQVERGLKIFSGRQKLADEGYIKITHKMLNPRPENYCVYWEEYHYPQINDSIYLQLVAILNVNTSKRLYVADVEDLKTQTLKGLISCHREMGAVVGGCDFKEVQDILVEQVRALFEEG